MKIIGYTEQVRVRAIEVYGKISEILKLLL